MGARGIQELEVFRGTGVVGGARAHKGEGRVWGGGGARARARISDLSF